MILLALVPAAAGAPPHDQAVASKIRNELNSAFAVNGQIEIATRIQTALAHVTTERDAPGKSSDLVLRDSEYYLHGLYGGAARDWAHILPTLGAPAYEALKWAALRCKDAGFPDLARVYQPQGADAAPSRSGRGVSKIQVV
jgi:hypothetical protein